MPELAGESINLIVTSPPYYNAPHDSHSYYDNYKNYLKIIKKLSQECYRVLQSGRIVAVNIDDILINGERFPIVADITRIFIRTGFKYRDRIIWKKPDGYVRISKRSGTLRRNPYPMYFYPDNLTETILIFQKGKFDYQSIDTSTRLSSKVNEKEFDQDKLHRSFWEIVNVSPKSDFEKNVAAFPEELPARLINLFSYKGEIVLDPFVGSGTTMKVARQLGRNSIGIEINKNLVNLIEEKLSFDERLAIVYR